MTLTPTDDGSGVDETHYTTGTTPAAPTTASAVYDPDDKPVLGDGESIRYFSMDLAGNAEPDHTAGPITVGTDLAVDVAAQATSGSYQWVTATTQASNLGPADVLDAVVLMSVPSGDSDSELSQTEGPQFTCAAPIAETVSCTGPLAAGQTASFAVLARAPGAGTMTHTASVSSSVFDPAVDNDADAASTEINPSGGGSGGGGATRTPTPTPTPTAMPGSGTTTPMPTVADPVCRSFTVGLRGDRYSGSRIRTATLRTAGGRWLRSLRPQRRQVRVEMTGLRARALFTVRMKVRLQSGTIVRVNRRHAACTG